MKTIAIYLTNLFSNLCRGGHYMFTIVTFSHISLGIDMQENTSASRLESNW